VPIDLSYSFWHIAWLHIAAKLGALKVKVINEDEESKS